ncbi:hypothetical protein ACFLVY_01885, partial [Chloroflexota bacterium]
NIEAPGGSISVHTNFSGNVLAEDITFTVDGVEITEFYTQLDDLALRIHELRNRQEKLQARRVQIESYLSDRRVELASPEIVRTYVDDLRNLLNNSSLAERRAFIRSFVKEVKVTGDKVLLTYTMPLSSRVSEEKVGVLSTVQYGGRYWT